MATRRHSVETKHMSSAPNRAGAVQKNEGGPELAVSDNAAVRADGFQPPVEVHNASPATYGKGGVPSRVPTYPQ